MSMTADAATLPVDRDTSAAAGGATAQDWGSLLTLSYTMTVDALASSGWVQGTEESATSTSSSPETCL